MTEGTWHANGALGVLLASIGLGIANAANAIAIALQDRVSMIVLTGCVPAVEAYTYTHQVFDNVQNFKVGAVKKAAFRKEPGTAGVLIDKAVTIATTGRPDPVVLEVPIGVQ